MSRLNKEQIERIKQTMGNTRPMIVELIETVEDQQQEIEQLKIKNEKAKLLLKEYEICSCCVNVTENMISYLSKDHPCEVCRNSGVNGFNWSFNEDILKP
jgi:hypothetical protein